VCALMFAAERARADDLKPTGVDADLKSMSLEELTRMTVSSVSRREQQLSKVAAAAYIITDDEIRRSGVTSLPELLRRVPGLQVARLDANKWAVSARGFNGRFANKMLVLIDGRSIYNNIYSGVYWDQQDVVLEDIERIEVIRGPGATRWGANAVNGVIHIITKKASATQGGLVVAQAGGDENGAGSVRYGGARGEKLHYRGFAKAFDRRALSNSDGSAANDDGGSIRGGGRVDWEPTERDRISFSGDMFRGRSDQTVSESIRVTDAVFGPDTADISGGYALTRWERVLEASDMAVQANYTAASRSEARLDITTRVVDLDFQHHFIWKGRHDIVWGGGHRWMQDASSGVVSPLKQLSRMDRLASVFMQDDLSIVPDKLVLTLGSKFLHNTYTGLEIQPGARLLWTPNRRQSWWASVARAVRTPSRINSDASFNTLLPEQGPLPVEVQFSGNPRFQSETMIAYEAGYRAQLSRKVSLDIAGFVNNYDRLEATVGSGPVLDFRLMRLIYSLTYQNLGTGYTRGVETSLSWNVNRRWRMQAGHAWSTARLDGPPNPQGRSYDSMTWLTPRNTVSLHSGLEVTRRLSVDATLYYVSKIPDRPIPQYARVDVRAAWKLGEAGELSAGLQNLQSDRHVEFPMEEYSLNSSVPRTAYIRWLWAF